MTALPAILPLVCYRGDPFEITVTSSLDGDPEAVVAGDVLAQVRKTPDAATVLATFTAAVDHSGPDWVLTLSLAGSVTAELPVGDLAYDVQPADDAETWLKGAFTVEADTSRPVGP